MFTNNDKFDLVIACDSRGGMGKNNDLPWKIPGDVEHFRVLTSKSTDPDSKNAVIMGRKTWESLPAKFRPLPNRVNVVLTRDQAYEVPQDVLVCSSLDEALEILIDKKIARVFVIGGAEVLRKAMQHPRCGLLYLTEIEQDFDCDVFLPDHTELFELQPGSSPRHENGVDYSINIYSRKANL